MKQISFLLLFLLSGLYALADPYDFSALQGLRTKDGNTCFEISGYDIFASSLKGSFNDSHTIVKLKKKYKIQNIQAEYSDSKLTMPNKVIEAERPSVANPDIKFNEVIYIFPKSEKEVTFVSLQTLNQRDIILEKEFITAFMSGMLESYISDDWTGNTISFAGRTIQLGTACQWRRPHNLYFRGGQINWSEFPAAETAGLDLDAQIAVNNSGKLTILSQDYIDVLFEDIPTIAYRVAYKAKYTYAPLIVYYVAQEVRGKYVSCVMSHYGNSRNDYELSPLLQQFMSITSPPDWAHNPFDRPRYEPVTEEERNELYPLMPYIDVGVGSVLPLGNLSRVFSFAPALDLGLGFEIKKNMAIDLDLFFAFPVKTRPFNFKYENEKFETKSKNLFGGNIHYRYNHQLKKDLFCSTYAGIGVFEIETDSVKEIDKNDKKIYHSVAGLDINGGVQLKYKHLGVFLEYHQTTLSNSSKVSNGFGGSFLRTGITYYFRAY